MPFANRLELEEFAIQLSGTLLEKMQIVHINEKDIVDSAMLLLQHDGGNSVRRQSICSTFEELTEEDRARVSSRIETLLKITEDEPKTLAWRDRARVRAKSKWYNDVDSVNG